jgi:hypothetical protein
MMANIQKKSTSASSLISKIFRPGLSNHYLFLQTEKTHCMKPNGGFCQIFGNQPISEVPSDKQKNYRHSDKA